MIQMVAAGGNTSASEHRDQAVVEAEDAAADLVRAGPLQAVRRQHPLRTAAEVRHEDAQPGDPQPRRQRQQQVAHRPGHE
jgi:hypothetical protein